MPTCAEAGVLGALAGVMGSLMAMEVIREIVGFGEGLVGRLLMMDAAACASTRCAMIGTKTNPLNGVAPIRHPGRSAVETGSEDEKNAIPATDSGPPVPRAE